MATALGKQETHRTHPSTRPASRVLLHRLFPSKHSSLLVLGQTLAPQGSSQDRLPGPQSVAHTNILRREDHVFI